ncbi:MAG TPA: DUF1501 domain-containing protein [Gemmataceae bacterium]|nr:DUF1501 domain-containing protein [Gemmataceae bacterium]
MHAGHSPVGAALNRRAFLVAGGLGFAGLSATALASAATTAKPSARRQSARSTILIWLSGGASHLDMWDLKPDAPVEYRGEFKPLATSAPGVRLCEHLPKLARQAHHLALINSLGHYGRGTGDHHAGYYYNLTGHAPDPSFGQLLNNRKPLPSDWPFLGSVVTSKRPAHPYLPSLITLPQKPGFPEYTRPGQFAARLGLEYDASYVYGSLEHPLEFAAPALTLQGDMDVSRLQARRHLLATLDSAVRSSERFGPVRTFNRQREKALSLLASTQTKSAFDVSKEPLALRDHYGATVNGMSMLMARRLVEAGVPFVTVFWKEDPKLAGPCKSGGGWDTHGGNFSCLRRHLLPEFDQCFSALLDDLHTRGLLQQTLVLVNSEMGRKPKVGDPRSGGPSGAGRDHWTHCMTAVMAGGGVRGGQTFGASDKVAAYPADHPVAPEDIARTVYHLMGVDDLEAIDREGRPFNLLSEGRMLTELL